MTLGERLAAIPSNCTLISSHGGDLQRDEALEATAELHKLNGLKVAICLRNTTDALRTLAALDGVADSILLLSPFAGPDLNQALSQRMGCDALIGGKSAVLDLTDSAAPVFDSISALIASRGETDRAPPDQTWWVMSTSGTTGTPKLVRHTLASLTKSTKVDYQRSRDQRWGMLYDYTRFAGLQVFLQSVVSGAQLIAPIHDATLDAKLELFAAKNCTHLSATPTLWRKIIMTPAGKDLTLKQVTLGGEIADDRILSGLSQRYPDARVAHIFASTEAGVGFSVADGKAGFPKNYLTQPPAGVEIKVVDARLFVRNPMVDPKYIADDASFSDKDGWVDTGDIVEITGDRVLFLGRGSGIINVGGDKVHPEEIERALLAHPLVAAARVYAKKNPITGALVAAEIELADPTLDHKQARDAIKADVAATLERHKVPALLKVVSGFETNTAGKLERKPT